VLLEIGNALSRMDRDAAVQIIEDLRESPGVTVVNLTPELFESAFELYRRHTDKLDSSRHVPEGPSGRSDKNLHVSRAYPSYALLKLMGKADTGGNRQTLHKRITRLCAGAIEVKNGRYVYTSAVWSARRSKTKKPMRGWSL